MCVGLFWPSVYAHDVITADLDIAAKFLDSFVCWTVPLYLTRSSTIWIQFFGR